MRRNFSVGRPGWIGAVLIAIFFVLAQAGTAFAQQDQGAITGTVTDPSGASVPNAAVTLTSVDTGLVLNAASDGSGNYTFSPIKIGNYSVSATAAGFSTTTQQNVHVDVQSRVEVNVKLNPGAAATTITVNEAPPLMQTEEASTGQVIQAKTINDTPLNGRNWVFIAQLTAGVAPPSGSRGAGKGDFNANGQRAEQNNFILDGVDNNTNVVDFLNGASFVVRPPPDALAEFKVQTGAYSAEFGHSAGAVVNASIKSGTNQIHGDLWEYIRNDAFDVKEYFNNQVSKYRQNQFGATLGLPIWKNKLFFFGDVEANRIIFANPHTGLSVPTAAMRQGDFSELLNPAVTQSPTPIVLYQPNSGGTTPLICNGRANVLCPGQIDTRALALLNLFPQPNTNGGKVFNNYNTTTTDSDNTFQWDARIDWNVSSKDQMFARHSYLHEPGNRPPPLGDPLDGGSFGDTGQIINLGQNFAFSETHLFAPTLSNEFRFGYNYGHFGYQHINANNDIAPKYNLGGIPFFPLNGGLPFFSVTGLSNFGSPQFYVSNEYENVFQILDNVTKQAGNHSLHAGVNFQHVRFSTTQPTQSRGTYTYDGTFTSNPGSNIPTGYGVADFLAGQMKTAALSNYFNTDDVRWYRAAYFQDDWKLSPQLTVNLGIRYDYYQPYEERHGNQAVFYPTGPLGAGTGSAVYIIPSKNRSVPLSPIFTNLLAKDNISLQYSNNNSLVNAQNKNFAPRFGVAYQVNDTLVMRGGYGLFYGGLESAGYFPNLGENYPFEFDSNFNSTTCNPGNCPNNGISLATGFAQSIAAGLQNFISTPSLRGSEPNVKTPYTQSYNISTEYSVSNSMVATLSWVGSVSRHLIIFPDPNSSYGLVAPSANANAVRPFPDFGGSSFSAYDGSSNYNSFQAKLERRFQKGLSFLGTYTYGHSLDNAPTPLGSTYDSGYRGTNIIPINDEYANSPFDVRHRLTVNGNYELPVGHGRQFLPDAGRAVDALIGGWSTSLVFRAQTGEPITVVAAGITQANGVNNRNNNSSPSNTGVHALRIGDPNKGGGPAGCPAKVRTTDHWYNPCAFASPQDGSLIAPGQIVRGDAAIAYLGSPRNNWYGPGYERVDMSLFKSFATFREQSVQFRADAFNVLNTPAYGGPSANNNSVLTGGQITSARSFQPFTPDSRFFQFALKYVF